MFVFSILYSALLGMALAVSAPYWLFQMARSGKYRAGLAERLGGVPRRLRSTAPNEQCIWVHAVSVGEVLAVSGLIDGLRTKFPDWRIAVSTTTLTGQTLARKRFGEENVFYLPLDLRFAVRRFMKHLRPRLLIIAETEFWPNLLAEARRTGRVAVVNARISDRSFPRYRRFRGPFRKVLSQVDLFLAQGETDKARLLEVGAPVQRVQVSGNLKFDIKAPVQSSIARQLRESIKVTSGENGGAKVLVAGSTIAGEETLIAQAFCGLLKAYPEMVCILAPRHPERFEQVERELLSAMPVLKIVRRSQWDGAPLAGKFFLLDSIGELAALYELATVAIVGGSFVAAGGHNILEPAQFGKPIVVGPHTENFRDMMLAFTAANAVRVTEGKALMATLQQLFAEALLREALGGRARTVFEQNAGATQRTLDALETLLWMPETLLARYRQRGPDGVRQGEGEGKRERGQ